MIRRTSRRSVIESPHGLNDCYALLKRVKAFACQTINDHLRTNAEPSDPLPISRIQIPKEFIETQKNIGLKSQTGHMITSKLLDFCGQKDLQPHLTDLVLHFFDPVNMLVFVV
jgi:hypothetical protein